MSFTTEHNGRLCNQIIRNIAANFIAEKFDLHILYSSQDRINRLGIPLFCGSKKYNNTINVVDSNYFEVLNKSELYSNVNLNEDYFQFKEIMVIICDYLRSKKEYIIEKKTI